MNILTISGSATKDSSNQRLLKALPLVIKNHRFNHFEGLTDFPLFTTEKNNNPPELVLLFKQAIRDSDVLVISFPEYIHNIPALLKNALEWITSSGEMDNKKVVVVSYTPAPPRGEQAMQSVVWSLQALNAKIVVQLPLYQSELKITKEGELLGEQHIEELKAVFEMMV